jgi:hypothetical protein
MVAFNPRATPESSPEPAEIPVSPPRSTSAKTAKARRKVQPSKGDAYLIRTSYPNHPEVARTAEYVLPSVDSGDESMGDDSDLDEKLALQMAEKERQQEEVKAEPRAQMEDHAIKTFLTHEEEMADAPDLTEQLAEEQEAAGENHEQVAEDLQQTAADALRKIDLSSPVQQPAPIDQLDVHFAQSNGFPPSRKDSSNPLGIQNIWIKPDVPITPVEPPSSSTDPFSAWSPLAQHRGSVGSPGGSLPAILHSPTSPEGATSPRTQLPSAKEILDIADKTIEAQRQRHASMSSMAAPSPHPNDRYRASFSNAHPSPRMVNDHISPKSSLALSPPSGLSRRESYPLMSSATTTSDSNTDITSPNPMLTPQSDNPRQSIDENTRTLPPLPGVGRPSISVATIPAAGSGGYKCDFPGCTAPPFQTSYLLK